MSFAWGAGERSRLLLDVVEPRRRELRLRGWAYPFGDDPPQQVEIRLNGERAAVRDLSPQPGGVRLVLERSLWRPGENLLELRYARRNDEPGEPPWAAGWDGLRLSDGRPAQAPPPRLGAAGELVLPVRTAVEWTIELPGDAWVAWDRLTATGEASLELATRDAGEDDERRHEPRSDRARLTARDAPQRPVTLALRAVGPGGELHFDGLRLHLPETEAASAPATDPAPTAAATATPPNLLVYLIDTLRADHLGAYGYPRPTSPEIDRFAGESVRWIEARAQSPWTRPSVATILTGLLPISHGVERVSDALPESIETLGERLQAAGYETALFTTNANITLRFGFGQGWDHYAFLAERRGGRRVELDSLAVNEVVFDWLAVRRDRARPFFLVVHTLDPHDSYQPRPEFHRALASAVPIELGCCAALRQLPSLSGEAALERAAALRQLYDAEIAQNDAAFGALLGELERHDLGDSTAVLLLSDHGEEFYDHQGWRHGWTLYEEMLRIPFVLRLPGRAHAGTVLPGPVDQIDVAPTLLELAGLPMPAVLPGTSVLGELRGEPRAPRVSLAWLARGAESLASATLQQWKLVRRGGDWIGPAGAPPYQLFGLASDPRERDDLALARRVRREWLLAQLRSGEARYRSGHEAEAVVLDPELEETLRALGYL